MAHKQYHKWLDRDEYPFNPHYYQINGQQLHYIDEGKGAPLVFVHGTPSWSFEYRKIIRDLRTDYRCIAMDHIGFGLSSKPEKYDYATANHSRTLEKFIHDKALKDITLVVHDFGGPIGINAVIRQPDLIKNLIVINSWLWSVEDDPDFKPVKKILNNPLLPILYKYLNFSPRFILPGSFGTNKPDKKILAHYTRPFANRKQRNGTIAFARSLRDDQPWFEEIWNKKESVSDKPTLLLWGMQDPVIPSKNLEKFESGFRFSTSVTLDSSGHFPQEEEPEQVIKNIRSFLMAHSPL